MRVLEAFDPSNRVLALSAIATRAALDPGTTFRIIRTLLDLGYLVPAEEPKRYSLGLKVLDLGFNAIARMDLHESARPVLRALVGSVNEAASIGVLVESEAVYIDRVQALQARLGVDVRVGSRVALYCSAIGHALIAHLPRQQRAVLLATAPRVKLTRFTPTSIKEIEARLALVRERGFAVSDQETVVGLRALAAPILDTEGHVYAALSVAAPVGNCSLKDFVDKSAEPVVEASRRLSAVYRTRGAAAAGFA